MDDVAPLNMNNFQLIHELLSNEFSYNTYSVQIELIVSYQLKVPIDKLARWLLIYSRHYLRASTIPLHRIGNVFICLAVMNAIQ